MPKYNVTITYTNTIIRTAEVGVSAKNEESAQEKIETRVQDLLGKGSKHLKEAFDWNDDSDEDEFEYEASEL